MSRLDDKRNKRARRKRSIRNKIKGTSIRPRLSVYKSNKKLYIQAIDDVSGVTLASASTLEKELRKLKNNTQDAEKIGSLMGERLKEKKISQVIFDRNGCLYHGVIKAIADGTRKAGINF